MFVSGLTLLFGLLSMVVRACPGDPADLLFAQYDGNHPGAHVAVIKDGAIVFERGFGTANLDTGERVTADTNFRLASITKQFTAVSILMLSERKSLSIDDPVARYLPELASVAPKVTLRNLLTHTSGLPEYESLLAKNDARQIVDRDVLELVAHHKPRFSPGAQFRYNNTGYALLALVIERVSKLSYSEFLRRNIFKPLGMTSTVTYGVGAIPHRAYGYSGRDGRFSGADQNRTTAVLGDGGIYSSTRDLVRWIDALDHNTLLDSARLAEAISPSVATDAPNISYGLGWRIGDERGEKVAFHTGTTSGFKNALLWVPSRKLAVIVLTNRREGNSLTLAWLMLDRFWDQP